jgi:hypothetical protein
MFGKWVGQISLLQNAAVSLVSFGKAGNLVVGFALLVLVVLLVQELGGSKTSRK